MRKLIVGLFVFLLAAAAPAQAQLRIQVILPTVLPQLVVVEPGVQVVPDIDEEVFFSDGYYWVRRDDRWYRARDYRSEWRYVEVRRVPDTIVRFEPGRYRRWRGPDRRDERDDRRGEREAVRNREGDDRQRNDGPPGRAKGHDKERGEGHDKGHDEGQGKGRGEGRGEGHGDDDHK
jgi:hypothetical protein